MYKYNQFSDDGGSGNNIQAIRTESKIVGTILPRRM